MAVPELSSGISPTFLTTYELFWPIIPNYARSLRITAAAGTKLAGPSYSGTTAFFPDERALQPKGLLRHAASLHQGFPHCKIPTAASRREFGPCLSPNVADHPLKSAIDQSLGRPLPHQQTNQVRATNGA